MNALILLSMVIVGAMAAPMPVVLQPGVTFQTSGLPTTFITSPQFLTAQQPAFLAQAAVQQEEQQQQQQRQEQEAEQAFLRDPNNPSTDVFLHSGFPLVTQAASQSPFTLTTTSQAVQPQAQSAQLVAAPQAQSAQLVAAPQQQSAQLVAAQPQTLQLFAAQPQQQFVAQQQPQVQQQQPQQTTFTFPAFQTVQQQPTTPAPPPPPPAQPQVATTSTQFATAPFIFTTGQQQLRTIGTPFTFQTVSV